MTDHDHPYVLGTSYAHITGIHLAAASQVVESGDREAIDAALAAAEASLPQAGRMHADVGLAICVHHPEHGPAPTLVLLTPVILEAIGKAIVGRDAHNAATRTN